MAKSVAGGAHRQRSPAAGAAIDRSPATDHTHAPPSYHFTYRFRLGRCRYAHPQSKCSSHFAVTNWYKRTVCDVRVGGTGSPNVL